MKKAPDIRFKDFTDAWEQRKVGDYLIESRIKGNTGNEARKITVKLWGKGVVEKNDLGGSEHTQYFIRKAGQFIYSKLDFLNSAFGVIPENLDEYESTADLPAFDLEGMNPHFMYYVAIQKDFYLKNGSIADGSRKAKRIHAHTFLDMPIRVPSLSEQNTIVHYLQHLDHLIPLHQRKLEKLKLMKEAMLDKMFPKEGAKVPEIRFKGFNDEWVSCSIGECFSERSERSAIGELLSVTINSGVIKASELNKHDSSSEDKSNYKCVKKDDIAYNSMRMWQGASGHSSYDGIVSPAYTVIVPKEGVNSVFFAYMFKKPEIVWKFEINSQGLTKDTWNLKYPALSSIMIMKPCHEEQLKIAESLLNIDHAILNHQHKLEKLKQFKESMLDKMFI
ncbi:MAG: restriction endonuclease subunit S [Ruminococcus sp.]|nr:restriction endonuclease subunit S [Ruminococcus sp.]